MFKVKINEEAHDLDVTRTSFLITINTQKAFTDVDRAMDVKGFLKNMMTEILGNFGNYLKMYIPDGNKKYIQVPLNLNQVRDGDSDARFEVGGRQHRLHVHAKVSFEHDVGYGFQVNLPKLRGDLPRGFHLDVKYLRDASANAKRYIHKYAKRGIREESEEIEIEE